jgi:hypothetical protein
MSLISQMAQIGWAAPDGGHLRNLGNQRHLRLAL